VVSSDDILCGHSLENDLKALKIVHTRVIDTSLLYPHPRGPPYKSALRHLTKRWLGREIQTSKVHEKIKYSNARGRNWEQEWKKSFWSKKAEIQGKVGV